MIKAIMILSLIVVGLTVLFIRQLKKTWAANAMLKQQRHAIHAFEELEGKIGELERKYEKAKHELEETDDPVLIANILNGLQDRVHSSEDNTPINPRRKTG